jgi:hypothetical protein
MFSAKAETFLANTLDLETQQKVKKPRIMKRLRLYPFIEKLFFNKFDKFDKYDKFPTIEQFYHLKLVYYRFIIVPFCNYYDDIL